MSTAKITIPSNTLGLLEVESGLYYCEISLRPLKEIKNGT